MVERRVKKGENNKKRGANLALGCREWLKGDKGADSDRNGLTHCVAERQ